MSGILALPKESAKLREGEIYICFAQSTNDIALLLQNIWSGPNPGALLCSYSQHFLFQSLPDKLAQQLDHCFSRERHQIHFWQPGKGNPRDCNLNELLRDAKRLHLGKGTRITLSVQEQTLGRRSHRSLRRKLAAWAHWARSENLRLQILVHGETQFLRPLVAQQNDLLAGVSALQRLSEHHYHYSIQFWRSPQAVVANEEYRLLVDSNGTLRVDFDQPAPLGEPEHLSAQPHPDEQCIYACRDALYDAGSNDSLEKEFTRILPSNGALIEHTANANAATFVFACSSTDEVRELASNLYVLRKRFGGGVKLLVRETRDCLRYSDEQFLSRSGANLVIPYNLVFSVFMTQLEAMQGQYFTRQLPATLEALMDNWPYRGLQGYFEPADFARHGLHIIEDSPQNDIENLLVRLRPAQGIPAEHCLSLCSIRRDGDLITSADDDLYLLLPACRLNDVEAALHSCFALPSEEIFATRQIYHRRNDIEAQFLALSAAKHFVSSEWGKRMLRESPGGGPTDTGTAGEHSVTLAKSAPISIMV